VIDLFPNAWHIARREYLTRVRSRAFLIVTVLLALIGLGVAMLPILGKLIAEDEATVISVHAEDGALQSTTVAALKLTLSAAQDGTPFEINAADDAGAARDDVRQGSVDGLMTVSRADDQDLSFDIFTDVRPTSQWLFAVRQAVTQVTIGDRLERAGVDPSQAGEIFAPTKWEVTPVDPNALDPGETFGAAYLLALTMVILTFMAVLTYGTWVASSVAEEKSSRVMELLVTAATPRQLLAGKVMGTGAAGLTQYLVVVIAAIAGLLLQGVAARLVLGESGGGSLEGLDLWVLAPFGVFFIGGFALYAILYAGLGSMASRQEDVQQVTGPMIVIGMVGYFASFTALNVPDASWVQWASLVPFFSPYLLPMRLLLSTVAPWEWLAAAALMVVFVAGALWVAARLYSAGVLLYGQRVGFRAVWKATRIHR
jgi:ABC-2 type transport system permease protein